ncbi:MAG: hypothetical protein U0929_04525 [Planctomycetaceae bacterium]
MSYEVAVLVSILRSLLAGGICTGLARVLVAWRAGGNQWPMVGSTRRVVKESGDPPHPGPLPRDGVISECRVGGGGEGEAGATDSPFPGAPPCHRASVVHTLCQFICARQFISAVILLPFFMPGLVVGYAYRNASLSLVQSPWVNELLYLAIVVSQLMPVAVLTLEWLPQADLGPSGVFCLQLVKTAKGRESFRMRCRALLAGEFPRLVTTGAAVALLCFQEVEVATLMQARGWAEWIFTKQAGGVELVDVWGALVLPVLYGVGLVVPVLGYWIRRSGQSRGTPSRAHVPRTSSQRAAVRYGAIVIMGVAWLLTVIWPVISLVIGAWRGAGVIQLRAAIWREIGDALVLAVTVTGLLMLVLWVIGRGQTSTTRGPAVSGRRGWAFVIAAGALLPGLLGSLALGLFLFELCQQIGWQPSYTPVPLVVGMVLFLLPRAIVMQAMLRWGENRPDLFLAEGLAEHADHRGHWGAAIMWKLRGAGRFWMLALLFWWSYLELTLPSLLRPAGMAPAPMRLYNFLHYGHIPGLAAMLVLVLAVPLVLMVGGHWWQSHRFRTTLR